MMLTRTMRSCKTIAHKIRFLALSGALAVSAGGCASVKVESQSFRVSQTATVESAHIATDADFARYDRLQSTELGIYFPKSQRTPQGDLDRIRQIFREAFLAELVNYPIVDAPGPSTMAVEASLIDLRNSASSEIPDMRSSIRELATPGSILFLMEMRDSESGRVLARAADSAKAPTIATDAGQQTDWRSIEDAAQHWAGLFRAFLDENFAH